MASGYVMGKIRALLVIAYLFSCLSKFVFQWIRVEILVGTNLNQHSWEDAWMPKVGPTAPKPLSDQITEQLCHYFLGPTWMIDQPGKDTAGTKRV